MRANYDQALAAILQHEGGYVNHPKDPGGATNKGVTQNVYDAYRRKLGLDLRDVKLINDAEITAIYKRQYWDKISADDLPRGVDYCLFDFAINSGVGRAAAFLQDALNVTVDGNIGPITIAAAKAADPSKLIDLICDMRQHFLQNLGTFATFGKGWTRRVKEVRERAKGMI